MCARFHPTQGFLPNPRVDDARQRSDATMASQLLSLAWS